MCIIAGVTLLVLFRTTKGSASGPDLKCSVEAAAGALRGEGW
jgi:hypothetical protein